MYLAIHVCLTVSFEIAALIHVMYTIQQKTWLIVLCMLQVDCTEVVMPLIFLLQKRARPDPDKER